MGMRGEYGLGLGFGFVPFLPWLLTPFLRACATVEAPSALLHPGRSFVCTPVEVHGEELEWVGTTFSSGVPGVFAVIKDFTQPRALH